MKAKLAINGGKKIRKEPFPKHPVIDKDEKDAVMKVLESGNLSTFIASQGENFLGGKKIREFEKEFAEYYGVKYAVAVNSGTAALHCAIVGCNVQPGEEVIVPPYTFTSTATCALMQNAFPVFADIEEDSFCISPKELRKKITPKTKAIIPVHLFGNTANMDEIMKIAKEHNLKVIEDCAQANGAKYKGKLAGTIGDCAIFSFQESKTMMTGEGGMLITNNKEIAEKAQMLRNHGEVIEEKGRTYTANMIGYDYRMTEIEAAIGIEQLKKLDEMNRKRIELAEYLRNSLEGINGIIKPPVRKEVRHVFWGVALKFDEKKVGTSRNLFVKALNEEGIPFGAGYVKPLYLNPIYHEKKPFSYNYFKKKINYDKGICPVTERLYEKELMLTFVCRPPATKKDVDDIINAFRKITENIDELEQLS